MKTDLERAWEWREARGIFEETDAVRVFHGPGEGSGPYRNWAVDRFVERSQNGAPQKDHFWLTQWEGDGDSGRKRGEPLSHGAAEREARAVAHELTEFLKSKSAASIVLQGRPEQGGPALPSVLQGQPPLGRFAVSERGARVWIQLLETRHPGLFLDHAPLREWLKARADGWRVLNTFAYTGSLSVAAGLGGASQVTTLDLSKTTVQWAEDNWKLNELPADRGRFIAGDVFEWLPRLKRDGQEFGCVILDPPSFSRGNKGSFSTAKDLKKLHELALELVSDGGVLVTSINSANVAWAKYEADVAAAAKEKRVRLEVLWRVDLPETFPTSFGAASERYLKGWALRVRRK